MRILILAICICLSCAAYAATEAEAIKREVGIITVARLEHRLEAFDGVLLGFDGGEWRGGLVFLDKQGKATLLNHDNIAGIVKAGGRILVFSGLAHESFNDGKIVELRHKGTDLPSEHPLVVLEGAPSRVRRVNDQTVSFLVNAGYRGHKLVYLCKSLTNGVVSDGNACDFVN